MRCAESDIRPSCLAQNELLLPNGFVWDLSKRLLYYNDTKARKIEAFDCDEAGVPVHSSRRTWLAFREDEGQPDVRAQYSLCTCVGLNRKKCSDFGAGWNIRVRCCQPATLNPGAVWPGSEGPQQTHVHDVPPFVLTAL